METGTILQRRIDIEAEFEEPLRDVVSGYAEMGYSMPRVAETLDVSVSSVKHYCSTRNIRFSRNPIEHREIKGRPARRIQHEGREKSLTQWAMDLGVAPCTIHQRMRRTGRPVR